MCIAFATALSLCVQGYQFGQSNHTVYLLDALRHAEPQLLENDWFTTQTFQYHALFGRITRLLMSLGILRPAFWIGYLALVVLLHTAWWRMVRVMGGGAAQFLVSQVIFQLMAAGTGLGMYMFLQDSAFLPSNISAVAMLWAIVLWLQGRHLGSAIALGIAGAFHLNYAPVVVVLWVLFATSRRVSTAHLRKEAGNEEVGGAHPTTLARFWVAGAAAVLPAAINLGLALKFAAHRTGVMPLADFVDIYVRLRHPHHYHPATWPAWLWWSMLLPLVPGVIWLCQRRREQVIVRVTRVFLLFALLVLVALVGAGAMYASESLIQASLYRFSIFPKAIACIATGFFICQAGRPGIVAAAAGGVGATIATLCLIHGPFMGAYNLAAKDPAYERACAWIRANTPADAIFLVPPSDERFRLAAARAIVVNFKAVPQLSGELIEWRRRMETVLDLSDLRMLPRSYAKTLKAMRDRYGALPGDRLAEIARQCGARYVLTEVRLDPSWPPLHVESDGNEQWLLYDLEHGNGRGSAGD